MILQHLPGREQFIDNEQSRRIPPIDEEIQLIRLLGTDVWAVTIHEEGLEPDEAQAITERLRAELGLPVVRPMADGGDEVARVIGERLADSAQETQA